MTAFTPVDPANPQRETIYTQLKNAIINGDIAPDERIVETKYADIFRVSRTPVREAIRMLELEGLVIMIPRRGAQVAQITEQDLNDVLEVRLGLEELAVRFACERITDEEIKALGLAVKEFEKKMSNNELSAQAEADVKFHEIIYGATHNRRLIQIINNIREQMYRYRIEYLKDVESRKTLVKEHYEICDALKRRDAESAVEKMCIHIRNQQEAILRSLEREQE